MTLKCIAGIETPDEGRIVLNDRVLYDSKKKINLPPQKRKVGYMFQDYALFPNMTVEQNIMAGMGRKPDKAKVTSYIEKFRLTELEKHYPSELSGGQKQRVALERAHVAPEQVDHVYMGCVIQAGLGQNVARQASLKAGLPIETPAVTVNVVCGSGLNCVNMAAQMIEAGDADIVVAGGMENMDMAPFAMMKGRYGYRMGAPMGKSELVDTMVNDALWDATGFNKHMGMTAENVCTNETYCQKVQMREAARLLKSTDLPVSKIAASLGYENRTQFYKVFQTEYQVVPTEYRKAIRAKK